MQDKFFKYLKKEHNINLNEQQRKAALHKDGPCLVLAVPGAGKTTVLITRLAILTSLHGVNPKNILSLTFSKAAAVDMKERFESLFSGLVPQGIAFSTIHSFALSVIRNYERMSGTRYKIIEDSRDRENKAAILKTIYREINNEFIADDTFEELVGEIGFIKNSMMDIEKLGTGHGYIKNFKEIYKKYEAIKKKHSYIDFDDMLSLSYNILRENDKLLSFYRNQYRYILVDEAQDSSLIQNKIVELVAKPLNNIYMVGDDDQSIYGFRAADPSQMLKFSEIYEGASIYFMEQNFRSTKNIVTLANYFIKANEQRYDKNLKTDRKLGGSLEIREVEDREEQQKFLLAHLEENSGGEDTVVLYRNNLSALPIVDALNRREIDFYMKDNKGGLLKYWITQDIIAVLSVALNIFDKASFERIYYKINSYLSKEVISYLKTLDDQISIFEGIRMCPLLSYWQKERFQDMERKFRELSYKAPGPAIRYIYSQLDYGDYVKRSSTDDNYMVQGPEMIISALEAIANNTKSIAQFIGRLKELEGILEDSKYNKSKNTLTLSTIHSSKGLEFNTCFIIDAVKGQLPWCESSKNGQNQPESKEYEEERRLFYVGMTRAKNNLFIMDIKSWDGKYTEKSDFVRAVRNIIGGNKELGNIVQRESEIPSDGIDVGKRVYHTAFGYGRVMELEDDIAVINFDKHGEKKIILSFCIGEKRLRIC